MRTPHGTEYRTEFIGNSRKRRVMAIIDGQEREVGMVELHKTAGDFEWRFKAYAVFFASGISFVGARGTWQDAAQAIVCTIEARPHS